jgi:hypothetical protein
MTIIRSEAKSEISVIPRFASSCLVSTYNDCRTASQIMQLRPSWIKDPSESRTFLQVFFFCVEYFAIVSPPSRTVLITSKRIISSTQEYVPMFMKADSSQSRLRIDGIECISI